MATRKNFRERKQKRREEALSRQADRDERSDREQLDRLFALGHARCKEFDRLCDRIHNPQN